MRWIPVSAALLLCACSHARRDPVQLEEARRAALELKSIEEMAVQGRIAPLEFESDSTTIKPSSYDLLDRIAEVLNRHPRLRLIVEGHTDDVGGDEYNKELSLDRASDVKTYLTSRGVLPESIKVYGLGKDRPVTQDKSERGRALNRRVEFTITTRDWESVY